MKLFKNVLKQIKIAINITSLSICVLVIIAGIFLALNVHFLLALLAMITGTVYFFLIYYGFYVSTFPEKSKPEIQTKNEKYLLILGVAGVISVLLWISFHIYLIYELFPFLWSFTKVLAIMSIFVMIFFIIKAIK